MKRPGIPSWFSFDPPQKPPQTQLERLIAAEEADIERERLRQEWLVETGRLMAAQGSDKEPKP